MSLDFCTRTTRKLRKLGYEKKVARRIAKFCYISMTFTCGLFGLFERTKSTDPSDHLFRDACCGCPGRYRIARLFSYTSLTAGPVVAG